MHASDDTTFATSPSLRLWRGSIHAGALLVLAALAG